MNIPKEYLLNGDQWTLRGDIIKWADWVNFLGTHTMYKLKRVEGYFSDDEEASKVFGTHYSLVPEEETRTWKWLFKKGPKLPFIEGVYGNSVHGYPQKNTYFKVYVTTSGFMIKPDDQIENEP